MGSPGPQLPVLPYMVPPQAPTPPRPPLPPSIPYNAPPPMYSGAGPMPRASEPYFVQPEPPPAVRTYLPNPEPKQVEPFNRIAEFIAGPSEPYTTYEGRRYMAEVKQDNTSVWVQANYIHWWVRGDSTPPLVTSGDPANPRAGIIGETDTTILLGGSGSGNAIGPKEFSGIQATVGWWLDPERLQSF